MHGIIFINIPQRVEILMHFVNLEKGMKIKFMIRSKKELKFYIHADRIMAGYEDGGWLHKLKFRLTYSPILIYLKHMRCSASYRNRGVKSKVLFLYYFMKYKKLGIKLGFSIGYDVFGYGLHIPHYRTIVVNGNCQIGNYAVLHTSICIGGAGKVVGDGLYVGTGAKVMGPIHLGDDVSIAS